jgi:hypothetical protein
MRQQKSAEKVRKKKIKKMKKDLATIGLFDYSLGMETPTTTPTTAPNLKAAYTAVPLHTTAKTTEGKIITCYYAKEQITCEYNYETKVYQIGEEINGHWTEKGLAQTDGYGMMMCDTIPWDKIVKKEFMHVREYKTTTWEILEK